MAFTYIPDYSTTAGTNTDINGVSIAEGWPAANINNSIRSLLSQLKQEIALFDTIAAGATIDVQGSGFYTVSSSGASISAFTVKSGSRRILHFQGANTLVYNGTSLIIPGAANLSIAANDCIEFVAVADNQVRIIGYFPASGISIIPDSTATSGYVLTSNGPGVAPTWNNIATPPTGSARRVTGGYASAAIYTIVIAEELIIKTTTGASRLVNMGDYGSTLCDITKSGISGLDTGSEASNTHYFVWVIDRTTPRVAVSITADNTTDTFTDTAHGMANGTPVLFGGGLPSGISGTALYYVINAATNTYQVATTPSGSAVNFTTNGSGLTVTTLPATMLSTSATAPTMPSGYTYKALVSWTRNDGSSNFIYNTLRNRRINFENQNVLTAGAITTPGSWETLTISSVIPSITQTLSGIVGRSDTAAGATYAISVSGSTTGQYWQGWGASNETNALNSFGGRGVFSDMILTNAASIIWTASTSSAFGRIDLNGFTF